MPRNNCDPTDGSIGLAWGDEICPKCATEMEAIGIAVEDLPLRRLRLCPQCYLVTWMDDAGFQARQGVPMKRTQPSQGWAGKPN